MSKKKVSAASSENLFEKYLGLSALIVGFVADTLALVAVFGAVKSESGTSFLLGVEMRLTIWGAAVITYIGILRRFWEKHLNKSNRHISRTFYQFIRSDLIQLQYPFLLIPFIFLLGFYILILLNDVWVTLGTTIPTFLFVAILIDKKVQSEEELRQKREKDAVEEEERLKVKQASAFWIQQIHNKLAEEGYVTDYDLSARHREKLSICQKAMEHYWRRYREQIEFVYEPFEVTASIGFRKPASHLYDFSPYLSFIPRKIWVLAKRDLRESRPWLDNSDRYFLLNVIKD